MGVQRFSKIPPGINQDISPDEAEDWIRSYLGHPIYLLGEAVSRLRGDQPGYDINPLDDLLPSEGKSYQIQWMKWLADRHVLSLEEPIRTRVWERYRNLFDLLATARLRPMPPGWEDRE